MLKPEYEDVGLSVWIDESLVALVWRAVPTEERVAKVGTILEGIVRTRPNGIGVIVLVAERVSPPPPALRSRIIAILRKVTPSVRSVAWVIPAEGFQGAMARSLFTAFFLMLRPSFKPQAFQSLRDGVAYVLTGIGRATDANQTALVAQLDASARES